MKVDDRQSHLHTRPPAGSFSLCHDARTRENASTFTQVTARRAPPTGIGVLRGIARLDRTGADNVGEEAPVAAFGGWNSQTAGSPASDEPHEPVPLNALGIALALLSAAGLTGAITVLYHGMGTIMETSGAFVASGGPYEIASPAPGWAWIVPVSVWAMLLFGGVGMFAAGRGWGESPILFGWVGLFLALGWNFLRLGFNPPEFMESTWGWIVLGVLFWVMALVPATIAAATMVRVLRFPDLYRTRPRMLGKPTRGLYRVIQLAGAAAGILGANALFGAVTGV